ncbi:MAG: ABC transporter permease, partial [Marinobacter sp.]
MTDTSNTEPTTPQRSQWVDVWDQFKAHKGAMLGGIIFIVIILGVFIGPWLWPYDAQFIDIRSRNQGPSLAHPFGTDQL